MARETKRERERRLYAVMVGRLGFTSAETYTLLRIERTLNRWFAAECGDSNAYGSWAVERDEDDGKPYRVHHSHVAPFRETRTRIADREAGARRRLAVVMACHPELTAFVQTDPRGCALYILRPGDVPEGKTADCCYTNGIAVCY